MNQFILQGKKNKIIVLWTTIKGQENRKVSIKTLHKLIYDLTRGGFQHFTRAIFRNIEYNCQNRLSSSNLYRSSSSIIYLYNHQFSNLHVLFIPTCQLICSPIKSKPTRRNDTPWNNKQQKCIPCADNRLLIAAVSSKNASASSFLYILFIFFGGTIS